MAGIKCKDAFSVGQVVIFTVITMVELVAGKLPQTPESDPQRIRIVRRQNDNVTTSRRERLHKTWLAR